ncbi:MAG TPA: energy transducer TonB [Hanamia sp.]|nr:energy transducer TonB [Hanamia sp.]
MEANQILQSNFLDILFDGKNKMYGAYDLRNTYNGRIFSSLMATMGMILLLIMSFAIARKFKKNKIIVPTEVIDRTLQPKPQTLKPLPPPVTTVSPIHAATTKVIMPRIVIDQSVIDPPPDKKQIETAEIGLKNLKGNNLSTGIAAPPSNIVGSNVVAVPATKKTSNDSTFKVVEIEATFPGGPQAWQRYIQRAIMAQLDEFSESDYGTCNVQFIVDKNGKVSNAQATTMKGTRLAEIAVNAISKGPNWIPAIQNGRYVNAYRTQPVTLVNPNQ